jgi:predicted dienelactone hydrolase
MRTVALVAVTALTFALPATPASADPALSLPAPTGSRPVGTTSLHLEDTSRADPWVPSVPHRELMVSLFYPAASATGPTKQFLTPAEAAALLTDDDGEVPYDLAELVSATRTNAIVDARPAGRRHSLPLVVLSPGFTKMRATLTSPAEDLASHGYVVAVVDHTYENVATTFPDGRVTGCAACGSYDLAFWRKLQRGRAADVSFVLDELTGRHPAWRGAGLIDPHRVGMAGHSVGGASTISAMVADPRIRAGIDIDGSTSDPLVAPGLSRPFLFLGRQNTYAPGTPGGAAGTWERDWPLLTGWKRWLVVAGMEHASFTDVGLVADQLGIDFGADTPAARGSAITRAYVGAFFGRHLRHTAQPLLVGPSDRYPEVTFAG